MKPRVRVEPTTTISTGGIPLLYDSGVLYDGPHAYYDRWYNSDGNLVQGEIPKVSVSKEGIRILAGEEAPKIKEVEE